ncbi:probable phospholipid hydroperoxide glutathione peroxidase [Diachasma alloeum]|uniref:probable phospholipid hydroperoxide glutathione peroxidase n=1 Tax=Diachasma alloeum TaxID=454923 RepID=UPI00073845A5|nr:probable phospholipid hydroperoxide glutathione peroxidase [Diachasma alloeum]
MLGLAVTLLSACLLVSADLCENGKDDHCMAQDGPFNQDTDWSKAQNIYQFHARDIHGQDVSLDKYRGHVLLIVNVASECGLTDVNYKQLVALHEKYADTKGLRILAFPSNQFANQEPGTSDEILKFIEKYNVKFDMFEKIDVNGENAHPLYKWLKEKQEGLITDDIKWNFTKFIINKEGKAVERYAPTTKPLSIEEDLLKYF